MKTTIAQTTNVHATDAEAADHVIANINVLDVDSRRAGGFLSIQVTPGHHLLISRSEALRYINTLTSEVINGLLEDGEEE